MLQAILKGKIRGLFDKVQDGIPWKKAYSSYEDFLTASVVSRMTYLPIDIFWRILKSSSFQDGLRKYSGDLEYVEFWPNWPMPNRKKESGTRRQPDVFLRFEEFDLIAEAKRDDSCSQNHTQWTEQLFCYLEKRNKEGERKQPIVLWVLGGMGALMDEKKLTNTFDKVRKLIVEEYPDEEIGFAVTPWKNILYSLIDLRNYLIEERKKQFPLISFHNRSHIFRLVDDIIEALRLHGIKEWHFLSETTVYSEVINLCDASLDFFKNHNDNTLYNQKNIGNQVDWNSLNIISSSFVNGLKFYGGFNE
jgi:hypothetical protein